MYIVVYGISSASQASTGGYPFCLSFWQVTLPSQKIQVNAKGTLFQLVWKPTVVPRQKKADMIGSNLNTNTQPSFSVAQSAENVFTSRSGKKIRNSPSHQCRSAKRLAEFLDRKK